MSRSVRDLRDIVLVSRLSYRDSGSESDDSRGGMITPFEQLRISDDDTQNHRSLTSKFYWNYFNTRLACASLLYASKSVLLKSAIALLNSKMTFLQRLMCYIYMQYLTDCRK